MKSMSLFLAFCAIASTAFAERQPFERYQSVVDRQMFGPLPPGFDPTKMPSEVQKSSVADKQLTQEQEKLKSAIHFSVINVTPDGTTAVGFTDKSDPKAPVHYYLKVGEKRNGWEVKTADAAEATMTIAKGEIEVSLKIGGDSARDATATSRAGAVASAPSARKGLLGGSLGARRRMRAQQAQEEKARAEAAAAEREAQRQAQAEADKAQRQAQAEADRIQREQERAEQRQQLQAIQEELKRVREEKAKTAEKKDDDET